MGPPLRRTGLLDSELAPILSAALAAFLAYVEVLGYSFTSTDALPLIESARLAGPSDLTRILTTPLLDGTSFAATTAYYRPLSVLSFALDRSLWNLDPFGYHLTDVSLHVAVTVLVYLTVRTAVRGRRGIAWGAAILFATHPVLVESVPAISRRQDILAALFMLAAFLLAERGEGRRGAERAVSRVPASLCYGLALGSKETAILLPILIVAHRYLAGRYEGGTRRSRVLRSLRGAAPFGWVTAGYLVVRLLVLGGLGGNQDRPRGAWEIVQFWLDGVRDTWGSLLDPAGVVGRAILPTGRPIERVLSLALVTLALVLLIAVRKRVGRSLGALGRARSGRVRLLLLGSASVAATVLLAYPFVAPFVGRAVQDAYSGGGVPALGKLMASREHFPPEHYLVRASQILTTAAGLLMAASLLLLLRGRIARAVGRFPWGAPAAFFAFWIAVHLAFLLVTLSYSVWNLYIAAIPFCGMLAILLHASLARASRIVRGGAWGSPRSLVSMLPAPGAALLTANLLVFSPLVRSYAEWGASGEITRELLSGFARIVAERPLDVEYVIRDLPIEIRGFRRVVPRARTVSYLMEGSIESWIDLAFPGNAVRVRLENRSRPQEVPRGLALEVLAGDGRPVVIDVRWENRPVEPATSLGIDIPGGRDVGSGHHR